MLNLSSQDFGELRSKITAFLARNAMKAQIESMVQWTNIMRNVTASNEILYPELPSKPIKIPTLQGYCTFFVKQIGVVIKSDKDNVAKAYFNDEDLALSPIIAELIDTGEYEFVECMPVDKNLINYKY